MAYFIQRKNINENTVSIDSGKNLPFPYEGACSTMREADVCDFIYDSQTHLIEFKRLGRYIVLWEVTQQTGVPADGQTFQLIYEDSSTFNALIPQELPKQKTFPIASSSTQLKTTSSIGVGIVDKKSNSDVIKLGLKNVSKDTVRLTNDSLTKAQILIYGLGDADGELIIINKRLNKLDNPSPTATTEMEDELLLLDEDLQIITNSQSQQNLDIIDIEELLTNIAQELDEVTTPSQIFSQEYDSVESTGISGFTMYGMYVENQFQFWISGKFLPLDSLDDISNYANNYEILVYNDDLQDWESLPVPGFEDRIYLWRSDALRNIPPRNPWKALSWYQGDATITPGWYHRTHPSDYQTLVPTYQDHLGIYVRLEDVEDMQQNDFIDFFASLFLFKPSDEPPTP